MTENENSNREPTIGGSHQSDHSNGANRQVGSNTMATASPDCVMMIPSCVATAVNPHEPQKESKKHVQFSDEAPMELDCSYPYYWHDEDGLDPAEIERRRSLIWYSRKDYQDFLEDRIATIRVYRSLQGEMDDALQEFYCLRGLEPYQSPSLHTELMTLRAVYVQAVLEEQIRSRICQQNGRCLFPSDSCDNTICKESSKDNTAGGSCFATHIKPHVEHMSKWAMQRAQRLAVMDAIESQKINSNARERVTSRRRSLVGSVPDLPTKRRRRLRRSSLPGQQPMPDTVTSPELNLNELKEMNRRLLEQIYLSNNCAQSQCIKPLFVPDLFDDKSEHHNNDKRPSSRDSMTLNTLMRASYQTTNNSISSDALAPLPQTLHVPVSIAEFSRLMEEEESLMQGDEVMERGFNILRRDSLYGSQKTAT